MTRRSQLTRPRSLVAIAVLLTMTAVGACSASDDSNDAASSGGDDLAGVSAGDAPEPAQRGAADSAAGEDESAFAPGDSDSGAAGVDQVGQAVDTSTGALIKTAAIELRSEEVGVVVDKLEDYVLTSGGQISSEETSTDENGEPVYSRIELKVPVDDFDSAVDRIAGLAELVSKARSTEDVTARLADVESRVESAQDSIRQLRLLFTRATQLGEIITLERELSDREANLEALQAQQRALRAKTSMSTIHVSISQPPPEAVTTKEKPKDQAGFVDGIKKGWDGLVTFVVGTSHALGLVLPLGALALLVLGAAWALVRRFTPSRPPEPQPSE